jgi:hypothetical protein
MRTLSDNLIAKLEGYPPAKRVREALKYGLDLLPDGILDVLLEKPAGQKPVVTVVIDKATAETAMRVKPDDKAHDLYAEFERAVQALVTRALSTPAGTKDIAVIIQTPFAEGYPPKKAMLTMEAR